LYILFLFSSPALAFDLEGQVKIKPPHPEPELLQIDEKHQGECGKEKVSPKLKVSPEGGVANAVVKIEIATSASGLLAMTSLRAPRPAEGGTRGEAILDQVNCEFSPHVLLMPAGSELSILNSEAMLHNVRAFDESVLMLFNVAMPKKGQVLKKRFKQPGRYILRCGVHHWMHAILVATEHNYYALTDDTGHFKITGIPDGAHTLSVWHESLGELRAEVNPENRRVELSY